MPRACRPGAGDRPAGRHAGRGLPQAMPPLRGCYERQRKQLAKSAPWFWEVRPEALQAGDRGGTPPGLTGQKTLPIRTHMASPDAQPVRLPAIRRAAGQPGFPGHAPSLWPTTGAAPAPTVAVARFPMGASARNQPCRPNAQIGPELACAPRIFHETRCLDTWPAVTVSGPAWPPIRELTSLPASNCTGPRESLRMLDEGRRAAGRRAAERRQPGWLRRRRS